MCSTFLVFANTSANRLGCRLIPSSKQLAITATNWGRALPGPADWPARRIMGVLWPGMYPTDGRTMRVVPAFRNDTE